MKGRKMIAPIIITILTVCWLLFYLGICFLIPMPWALKVVIGFIFLALIGVSIKVLMERIKEIRSGEEDDLSKY